MKNTCGLCVLLSVLLLRSFPAFSQTIDIKTIEVVQKGDSVAMLYVSADSTTLDSTKTLKANQKVRSNTWVYVLLNEPLTNRRLEVAVSRKKQGIKTRSFTESESLVAPSPNAVAKGEYLYKFYVGALKLKKGKRTMHVSIKDAQGNELTKKSKLF